MLIPKEYTLAETKALSFIPLNDCCGFIPFNLVNVAKLSMPKLKAMLFKFIFSQFLCYLAH